MDDLYNLRHLLFLRFPFLRVLSLRRQERRGARRVVLERRLELLGELVVSRQAVNARFDENQAELGVHILTVALQVLALSLIHI